MFAALLSQYKSEFVQKLNIFIDFMADMPYSMFKE